ncbi:ferredoxin [Gordonibacter sp. 28C]|uniref:ATP-binding protein n=1 Tax=Gordonibacter sp. 28C TaxID=2078569 RepID=UPI000DF77D7A|nr:4Fe-4S dicluster domain-containing protein [Gordonibacter sp. 28C]RDB60835.1 ferredoxin [Gordonibacter sp. 28C]
MTESPFIIQRGSTCSNCGACVRRCARGNFAARDGVVAIAEGYVCTGCGDCVKWCPVRALSVKPARPVAIRRLAR